MNAGELIEKLSEFPADTTVLVPDYAFGDDDWNEVAEAFYTAPLYGQPEVRLTA